MTQKTFVKMWFILTIATTGLAGLVYLTVQQNLRQGANDPQIQIAQDVAGQLDNNKSPVDINPNLGNSDKTDISKSLGVFITIYDETGKPTSGTGLLHRELPKLPQGIFTYTKKHGEDRVTWEPETGVRNALIVVPYNKGFVAVGRSLLEVENRSIQMLEITFLAWLVTTITTLILALAFDRLKIFN